jgi:gliding motility-associated-like protein
VSISYTTGAGCVSSVIVTVNPAPSGISGSTLLCTSTTLTDVVIGGHWTSSDPTIATVGYLTGLATGLLPGTATITYTLPGGCFASLVVTVDPIVPITGSPDVCQGATTSLSYPSSGGTWSSANPAIATVGSGGTVSGISAGATTISYVTSSGCIATVFVTVHSLLPITGAPTVCQGGTTVLSDGTSAGSWSSSDGATAPVGALSGVVSGVAAGSVTITYTTGAGCIATYGVTVNPLNATTGPVSVCVGSAITLANSTPGGGAWSSVAPGVASVGASSGIVTGVASGSVNIKFTTSLGCVANYIVTVDPVPPGIIGALSVCLGSTSSLSTIIPGGAWSSSDVSVATVGSATGVLTGITVNTVTITYTTGAGCQVSAIATVNPLPLSITGMAIMCQGSSVTLADATPGGTWSSITPFVATVGSTGIVSGVNPGTSFIRYTTPAGCFTARQVTVNALPSPIGGTTVLCEGTSSLLTNALTGGTWGSSDPGTASIGTLSGLLSGVAAGNATITYITAAGCFVTTGVTVNTTPVISGFSATDPTTCVDSNGTITLSGLAPGASYSVSYVFGSTSVLVSATADGSGNIVLTGLAAGSYSIFTVTTPLNCTSNVVAGPIVLSLPPTPATPVAANNTPVCAGSQVDLTATCATAGVSYSWSGPAGFTSTVQNPIVASSTVAESGVYTVTATKAACVSAPATTTVLVHPMPVIVKFASGNPSTCLGADGSVILEGLDSGVSYTIHWTVSGTGYTATKVADGSGYVTVGGLKAGAYTNITVNSFGCISNAVGPAVLSDPSPAPAPTLWSNSPICAGKTLTLTATDAVSNLAYDWEGPRGFVSNLQNPTIPGIAMADSGIYTLTIRHLNCITIVYENIMVHPSVVLRNVTPDQVVPLGGTITLRAEGADFYVWSPNDGTLNYPYTDSPSVTTMATETYTVKGENTWGCFDTASVTLTVDDNVIEFVPNAFTPNNDGRNDIFRVVNVKYDKLVEFKVFNRWGQLVYNNDYDPNAGWDGTYHGVPQDIGTYFYIITFTRPDGKTRTMKGEVVLMR